MVNYDEVDGVRKSVRKSSKSRQKSRRIVKEPKRLQRSEKFAKNIGSEERLPKDRSSVNKKLELPLKTLTVFQALFTGPRSSLDTTFASIIDKPKANRAADTLSRFSLVGGKFSGQEHSNPLPTQRPSASKVLSAQHTSSLRYFSLEIRSEYSTSRQLENSLRTPFFRYFNSEDALRKKTSQPRIDGLRRC